MSGNGRSGPEKPTLRRRIKQHVAVGSALFYDELKSLSGAGASVHERYGTDKRALARVVGRCLTYDEVTSGTHQPDAIPV